MLGIRNFFNLARPCPARRSSETRKIEQIFDWIARIEFNTA